MRIAADSTRHRTGSTSSKFGDISKTVGQTFKNVFNAAKKDDDLYSNDIQYGRRKRGISLMDRLKQCNIVGIAITVCICIVFLTVCIGFLIRWLLLPSPTTTFTFPKIRSAHTVDSSEPKQVAAARKEVNRLLQQMRTSKDDIHSSLYHDWDESMSKLTHKYCLDELEFKMNEKAITTFEAHVSYLFSAVLDKDEIFGGMTADNAVVTEWGTLNAMENQVSSVPSGRCSLVSALFELADAQKLLSKLGKGPLNDNPFGKTNDDVWFENKDRFFERDINDAAWQVISLVKGDGDHMHLAKQILPHLFSDYCPNVRHFLDTKGNKPNLWDTAVSHLETLFTQLREHKYIHVSNTEIPAFDKDGTLVAVKEFSAKDGKKFEDSWATCAFVSKIVYYHNKNLEQQVVALIDEIKDNNHYAFENQVDLLMLEHCPETVKALQASKADHLSEDAYLNVFRAEFKSFVTNMADQTMTIAEPEEMVVTDNGGIMHKWATKGSYTKCSVINAIARHAPAADSGKKFDENMFNPDYHDSRWHEWMKQIKDDKLDIEHDAQNIAELANSGNSFELKQTIRHTLDKYHNHDVKHHFSGDELDSLVVQIEHYISAFLNYASKYPWMSTHRVAIDIDGKRLVILEEDSEAMRNGNKVQSMVFTEVFKKCLSNAKKEVEQKKQTEAQKKQEESKEVKSEPSNNQGSSNDDSAQIKTYVSVLLHDIKNGNDFGAIKEALEQDLEQHCNPMWKQLGVRGKRVMLSQVLSIVQNNPYTLTDPVVTADGNVVGLNKARDSETLFRCNFLTELLTQRR